MRPGSTRADGDPGRDAAGPLVELIAVVENSTELVGIAELDGRLVYVNKTGRLWAGIDDDSLEGMTVFDFALPEKRGVIAETVIPEVRRHGSWSGVSGFVNRRTGETRAVDITLFTIPARQAGCPMSLAITMRDITERQRALDERRRLEDQLRQSIKMESVGRLAGGVAHDFNNLLTSILGNVAIVLDRIADEDPIRPPLLDVQRAGESAASLTRQLLAFSRKQAIEPTVVDLHALVGNMKRMLARIIGEDVVFETRWGAEVPLVWVDPGQIEQVIVNLVVNARDAMPKGGRLLLQTSDAAVDEGSLASQRRVCVGPYVRLAVSDTGCGMSDEVKAHLFEPFFTTKATGTGLGLATVYGAVTQNGGYLDVCSEVGRGTTFQIFLPQASAPARLGNEPEEEPASMPVCGTILHVEDAVLVRELTSRVLEEAGYQVLSWGSAEEALEACARHDGPIDLLMTDVVLPGMRGPELASRIQASRPGVRTLFSSGYAENVLARYGLPSIDEIEFIGKPYSPRTLLAKVRAILS